MKASLTTATMPKAFVVRAFLPRGIACFIVFVLLLIQVMPAWGGANEATKKKTDTTGYFIPDNNIYQQLPFSQNWSDTSLLSQANNWNGMPGIQGFAHDLGNIIPGSIDPQTWLIQAGGLSLNPNRTNPDSSTVGGVSEFEISDPVIALYSTYSVDISYIVIYLDTTGYFDIQVSYNLRDIDVTSRNAIQRIALQYRIGEIDNYTNLPEGFVADATIGPNLGNLVTPVNVTLPPTTNDQPKVQIRLISIDELGTDEWVGIDDIVVTGTPISNDIPPTISNVTPADQAVTVPFDSSITINFSEAVVPTGDWFTIDCSKSGIHPATAVPAEGAATAFTLTPSSPFVDDESCRVTVVGSQVSDVDWIANPVAADYTWGFLTYDPAVCGTPYTPIHAIQGSGDSTPLSGMLYTEGIVTGNFISGMNGYFIQTPAVDTDADPATSEGIFISVPTSGSMTDVQFGDHVRVYGPVNEHQGMTEITEPTQVTICASGEPVSPIPLLFPPDNGLEPYEGMYVQIETSLTTSQSYFLGRFGQLTLSSGGRLYHPLNGNGLGEDPTLNLQHMLILDDGSSEANPNPIPYLGLDNTRRAGDIVSGLKGIIDQGVIDTASAPGIHYRLQPAALPTIERTNPRSASPEDTQGRLTIASFNLMNYFTTLDISGANPPTARGADSTDEFTRQRDKIISALVAMDADVVGLVEVENNGSSDPLENLVNGLNEATRPQSFAYVQDSAPSPSDGGDNIKTGLLYQPGAVTPIGDSISYQVDSYSGYTPLYDRPPLAQTFNENATGALFTVIVNHFTSRGCDEAAGPDADRGDGQGCWSAKRTAQAEKLLELIETLKVTTPRVLVIGDLNAYGIEGPINTLASGGLIDEIAADVPAPARYSYIFNGQAGYLDHMLATQEFHPAITGATIWHINADEPAVIDYNLEHKSVDLYAATPYRSSDHDPVLIGLSLPTPGLTLGKSVKPAVNLAAGETVTYTLHLTNEGSGAATGVALTDVIPEDLTFDRFISASGAVIKEKVVFWEGDLAPGGSVTITFEATVLPEAGTGDGLVTNTASFITGYGASGWATATFSLRPNLTLAKTVAPASDLLPGDVVTYTLILNNQGMGKATGVELYDCLPAGLSYAGPVYAPGAIYENGALSWSGELGSGKEIILIFRATIDANLQVAGQVITNTATFTSDNAASGSASVNIRVRRLYRLLLPSVIK